MKIWWGFRAAIDVGLFYTFLQLIAVCTSLPELTRFVQILLFCLGLQRWNPLGGLKEEDVSGTVVNMHRVFKQPVLLRAESMES